MRILLALFFTFILLTAPALATSVTVDIFGTNVSNAQANITKTGNNSFQVVQWAIGDTTKNFKADINGNASDDITFTLHNFTVGRVVEVKVNSSSFNAYQADSTGTISFTRTQTVRNQTYSFSPAVNAAGYNFTWAQFWTYPFIQGVNLSTIITNTVTTGFLPFTGTTSDLNMNGKNITNVRTLNVTTTNVTVLNATNIQGNGSGISALNATNLTGTIIRVVNISQNYTIGTSNASNTLFTCYATSGTLNLTLPTGINGTEFTIKKKDNTANTCSVFSSQNIDGVNYANISTQYNSINVVFTENEWSII